jgi:hypothetical protein
MKWITRSHIHVDRVACPWLIKRFVDSEAQFIFVTAEAVESVARKEGATPFDVKGAELGHKEGHCSFVSIMERYGLKDPALLALADVVNAADTAQFGLSTYAAGLDALAQGFPSCIRMTSRTWSASSRSTTPCTPTSG